MKRIAPQHPPLFRPASRRGYTLIEVTLVIGIMLTLAGVVTYSITSMIDWQKGRAAAELLKGVYVAQKGYLADHPTKDKTDFTEERLIPYLPGQLGALPTAKSLEGTTLQLDFSQMPPSFQQSGTDYDPSGSSDDGLWDVGNI